MWPDWWTLALPALCAGLLPPVALRAGSFAVDHVHGVQKLHAEPTSRLGGLIVIAAFAAVIAIGQGVGHLPLASAMPLLFAAVPIVLVGSMEDATRRVRPRYRLLAAIASAALASFLAGGVIPRLDVPVLDAMAGIPVVLLGMTWFMVAGSCNAINLIDGAHGLAGGTALILFGGLALAAGWSGDAKTLAESMAMMGAVAGFLLWNYPRGRIFLGDAGAYFIGFMYAELAMRLVARNPELSAWYVIVLAGYPIVDTVFSMYRRAVVRRRHVAAPDALHLHSLIFRRIALPAEQRFVREGGETRPWRANARVAPRLWVHSLLCLALAVILQDNTPALMVALAAYAAFYVHRYRSLVRFRGRRGARLASLEPLPAKRS